jgi:hypothetical protein
MGLINTIRARPFGCDDHATDAPIARSPAHWLMLEINEIRQIGARDNLKEIGCI